MLLNATDSRGLQRSWSLYLTSEGGLWTRGQSHHIWKGGQPLGASVPNLPIGCEEIRYVWSLAKNHRPRSLLMVALWVEVPPCPVHGFFQRLYFLRQF